MIINGFFRLKRLRDFYIYICIFFAFLLYLLRNINIFNQIKIILAFIDIL